MLVGIRRIRDRPVGGVRHRPSQEMQEEQMVGSIDPRCETLRGTQWRSQGRGMIGTRVAETILASGPNRPHQQAGHMDASDPNRPEKSCGTGAFHYGSRRSPGRRYRLFPHHLPQLGLQHLAVVVLRQRVEIDVALGPLEARDRGEAMRVQLGVVRRAPSSSTTQATTISPQSGSGTPIAETSRTSDASAAPPPPRADRYWCRRK